MGRSGISVVAIACRFAEATSPDELWRNVVNSRQSFRAIPAERLDVSGYAESVRGSSDSIYPVQAGLLTNWTFDRQQFKIPLSTFNVTDPTHWLALELSAEAIASLGGPDRLRGLNTAVVVANTLTGDVSRSAILRQRAPFLEGIVGAAATAEGLSDSVVRRIQARLRTELAERLPEPNEDSLAGGLSNTIAGRVANYFDFRGGAYVVDGACASSLVALADAANLIATDQADVAIVAAVDLSIDPFELIGFSRTGALARQEMRIFDERAAGFWPGEGGAVVILMREKEARAREIPDLAHLRGWAISSDGAGGMTRPTVHGQELAYRRAYERAAVDPADLDFVEAHGTGTRVGDRVEITALSQLLTGSNRSIPVGSIKGNIGHTKAAAGLAGLTKAVMALRHRAVGPHVGCITPASAFAEAGDRLRPAEGEPIADAAPGLAGISAFGFGGINAHVVLEAAERKAQRVFRAGSLPPQDAELFTFSGDTAADVLLKIEPLSAVAATLSRGELADAALAVWNVAGRSAFRVAIVAGSGDELREALETAGRALKKGDETQDGRVYVSGGGERVPRIGFLFPGQGGSIARNDAGIWRKRFPVVAPWVEGWHGGLSASGSEDARIQSGTVAASLAAASVLEQLGVVADAAIGHSLGEVSALAWAGAFSADKALEFATARGQAMADLGVPGGGMAAIRGPRSQVERAIEGTDAVVACINGPAELVVAGSKRGLDLVAANCRRHGLAFHPLEVRNAFHSGHMRAAAGALRTWLEAHPPQSLSKAVASTILGSMLNRDADLADLLVQQLTSPVRFDEALQLLATQVDLIIEVGPSGGLSRLAKQYSDHVVSVDAFGLSLRPLLEAIATVFCAGGDVDLEPLFVDRAVQANLKGRPSFLSNPCGTLPEADRTTVRTDDEHMEGGGGGGGVASDGSLLEAVIAALEAETGLPPDAIGVDDRFLDSLHLNSLAVARVIRSVAGTTGIVQPASPTDFANATARELAALFEEVSKLGPEQPAARIQGVRRWLRPFRSGWVPATEHPGPVEEIAWQVIRLGENLPSRSSLAGEAGLVIHVAAKFGRDDAMLLFRITQAAARHIAHLAIVHDGAAVAAFARSIAAEGIFRSIRVIDRAASPEDTTTIAEYLKASISGYAEVRVGATGLEVPSLLPTSLPESARPLVERDDVVVVIGGGRGIAAECALSLGSFAAQFVLVGRSTSDDPIVVETLRRAGEQGIRCRYVRADVLDRAGFAAELGAVLSDTGPATALIYAAGVNQPAGFADLSDEMVYQALAAKLDGLSIATEVLGESLRTLITFGSLIGCVGLEGEAHYALGNAMQTAAALAWQEADSRRSALAIEWSVWGGIGMGERLGAIERLERQGIDALPVADAIASFDALIRSGSTGSIVIAGRFGTPPGLSLGDRALPLLRFVDSVAIHHPGVELVVETSMSPGRDSYLTDHVLDGEMLVPGVILMEAMAQAAHALDRAASTNFEIADVRFNQAVAVTARGITLRVAALKRMDGVIETAVLSSEDGYASALATSSFRSKGADTRPMGAVPLGRSQTPGSARPFYGNLFFCTGKFARVERVEVATAREVVARLGEQKLDGWFGAFDPQAMVLWRDPGTADAALHVLQVTFPQRRLLPVGIKRLRLENSASPPAQVYGRETGRIGPRHFFDVVVMGSNGECLELWEGIELMELRPIESEQAVNETLAVSYLERLLAEEMGLSNVSVAMVDDDDADRGSRRDEAMRVLKLSDKVQRAADGGWTVLGGGAVSVAHAGTLTLVVAAEEPLACDVEPCRPLEDGDAEALAKHCRYEVHRKLGRRTRVDDLHPLRRGTTTERDGVRSIVAELELNGRTVMVAAGRLVQRSDGLAA